MLLIGDIHIHPRYCNTTIDMLRWYINTYPEEKNIIFVWDYVYHFSYHRVSLLALLDFFLELVHQDKQVYILAGNHDRLWQHFVYTEAQKILYHNTDIQHHIHFITEPCVKNIEDQTIIFMPYILNRSEYIPQSESYNFEWVLLASKDSLHAQTKASYLLNTCMSDMIKQERAFDKNKELVIIHHYYTANTIFPGLKTVFSYKDIALSPQWMDDKNLRIISGHIHHAFAYKNYLCIWSMRSTSPLEANQLQYLFHYRNDMIHAQQIAMNPYLTIHTPHNTIVNESYIQQHRQQIQQQSIKQFKTSDYQNITYNICDLPLKRTTLTISSNNIAYETLWNIIEPILQQQLYDIKIKQDLDLVDILIEDLVDVSKDFSSWRSDWKILLEKYIERKFWEKKDIYINLLQELKIYQ